VRGRQSADAAAAGTRRALRRGRPRGRSCAAGARPGRAGADRARPESGARAGARQLGLRCGSRAPGLTAGRGGPRPDAGGADREHALAAQRHDPRRRAHPPRAGERDPARVLCTAQPARVDGHRGRDRRPAGQADAHADAAADRAALSRAGQRPRPADVRPGLLRRADRGGIPGARARGPGRPRRARAVACESGRDRRPGSPGRGRRERAPGSPRLRRGLAATATAAAERDRPGGARPHHADPRLLDAAAPRRRDGRREHDAAHRVHGRDHPPRRPAAARRTAPTTRRIR
jgi:hypothetical protein